MSESQIQALILDALSRSGKGLFWRNNVGQLRDARGRWVKFGLGLGSPDIVGVLRPSGRFVALEVKAPDGRVTPEQEAWHRAARAAGALVAVVRSVEDALVAIA